MSESFSLADSIQHLGKAFQSIDCRAVTLKKDKEDEKEPDIWTSLFVAIRFSHASTEVAQTNWRKRLEHYGDPYQGEGPALTRPSGVQIYCRNSDVGRATAAAIRMVGGTAFYVESDPAHNGENEVKLVIPHVF